MQNKITNILYTNGRADTRTDRRLEKPTDGRRDRFIPVPVYPKDGQRDRQTDGQADRETGSFQFLYTPKDIPFAPGV